MFLTQKHHSKLTPSSRLISGSYSASYYNPIPEELAQFMNGKSYKKQCPIKIKDLAYVCLTHYDMNGKLREGELVVHETIGQKVLEIFHDLYIEKFLIEKMRLVDFYDADDDRSMADNNSYGFCFRQNVTYPDLVSKHGYGLAIDLNPLLNPYKKGNRVLPESGRMYLDRSSNISGLILANSPVVKAFVTRGFIWGGDAWSDRVDYQHFEI